MTFLIILLIKKYFQIRKSDATCADHWNESYNVKWSKSTMNTLLKRPNAG